MVALKGDRLLYISEVLTVNVEGIEKVRTVRFSKADQEVQRTALYVGTPITGMHFNMKFGKVDLPKPLLDALRDNRLVVFAGAGVSMGKPACLPDFCALTNIIAEHTNKARGDTENLEEFLGRLHDDGTNVYEVASSVLSRDGLESTPRESRMGIIQMRDTVSGNFGEGNIPPKNKESR